MLQVNHSVSFCYHQNLKNINSRYDFMSIKPISGW